MEPRDLIKVWNAPDNTRLTPKQISIRLPLHVAAKVSALCEMFPKKTKTEIVGDLLATALDDVAEGLSNEPYHDEEQTDPDEICGERKRYGVLVERYLKEMELEIGDLDPTADGRNVLKQAADDRSKAFLDPLKQRIAEGGARAAKRRRTRDRSEK